MNADVLREVRAALFDLAKAHRTVIPPPELTATILVELARKIGALIPAEGEAGHGR